MFPVSTPLTGWESSVLRRPAGARIGAMQEDARRLRLLATEATRRGPPRQPRGRCHGPVVVVVCSSSCMPNLHYSCTMRPGNGLDGVSDSLIANRPLLSTVLSDSPRKPSRSHHGQIAQESQKNAEAVKGRGNKKGEGGTEGLSIHVLKVIRPGI
ncbi:hypothetical protein VTJ49DRAFT_6165 [Mycothermus thermophilus]|uniref:Uncharacterized protein n=1 Tax=Humicola insolens TaxID=85995 RepID=A0ABR3V1Y0_HUMIN